MAARSRPAPHQVARRRAMSRPKPPRTAHHAAATPPRRRARGRRRHVAAPGAQNRAPTSRSGPRHHRRARGKETPPPPPTLPGLRPVARSGGGEGRKRSWGGFVAAAAEGPPVTRGSDARGLQDEIKLVAINLEDKPAWYKEKVYPQGTVPSLEHDGKVAGESLDLIKYIDSNFQGPALLPQDPAKRQFAEELIAYADAFTKALYAPLISRVDMSDEAVAALDKVEAALSKFSDGPFFLGELSLADIAYVTILERVQIYYSHLRNYEIAEGRPNLEKFIEEINKVEAYKQTKNQPLILLDAAKRHLKIA